MEAPATSRTTRWPTRGASAPFAIAFAFVLPSLPSAQLPTSAQRDSGWVALFDGASFAPFQVAVEGEPPVGHADEGRRIFTLRAADSAIHTFGRPTAHLATKRSYSHYRLRLRIRYDWTGNMEQNAGVLYHVDLDAPRLYGAYPRSVECQGKKSGFGEAWTIGNVYVNTTIDPAAGRRTYMEGGQAVTHGNPDGRQCAGSANPYREGEWNEMEIRVRGADSAAHAVNGMTVFRCWKLRWSEADDPDDPAHPLAGGAIALQGEGAEVAYKDILIMELDPATGSPLHGVPTLAERLPAPPRRGARLRMVGGRIIRDDPATGWIGRNGTHPGAWILGVDGRVLGSPAQCGQTYSSKCGRADFRPSEPPAT